MKIDFISRFLHILQGCFIGLFVKNSYCIIDLIILVVLFLLSFFWENRTIKKTSAQWQKEHHDVVVIDPDGWDRSNFDWSWHKERITLAEYYKRRLKSTCKWN